MKILASDGMPNDYFGLSLAVHERQSLIAAPYRNSSAGGVYQFNIPFSPTFSPTISAMPTTSPTVYPTNPTFSPTFLPSKQPSFTPTCIPTSPTYAPSRRPTCSPSLFPTTRTSSPTERVVLSNKSDNSNQDTVHSVVFIVFLSIVGVASLLSLICCLCNHRSRSNDDGNIQMTSVVSVAPAGPQFPSDSRFGSNPVASAVLVPYSSSPTHPQPVPLVVPNVVNDHQSVVTSADIQLPVAIVIP